MTASQRTEAAASSGKGLLWGAVALVASASAFIVWLLWPTPEPERPDGAEPLASAVAPSGTLDLANAPQLVSPQEVRAERLPHLDAAPVSPSQTVEVVDLFEAPAPEILSRGHEFAAAGRPLRSSKVKEVYEYGKEHPGDARPHIILGLDSMNRHWYDFAINHYRKATREDPRAKQDPRILRDLIQVSGFKHQRAKAADAILEIYGAEALPEVSAALAEAEAAEDTRRVESLFDLQARLRESTE